MHQWRSRGNDECVDQQENTRYDSLLKLPTGVSLGAALVEAMNSIEEALAPRRGQLPKEYVQFDDTLIEVTPQIILRERITLAAPAQSEGMRARGNLQCFLMSAIPTSWRHGSAGC